MSVLVITIFPCIISGATSHEKSVFVEKTIEAIEDCMERSPASWSDEWNQEYLDTIRKAIFTHKNTIQYDLKLEILCKGFESYWLSFKKNNERFFFELYCARIRWYIEHLMGSEFPSKEERRKLRDQYTDIWNYAADSLLEQFPFLDPNVVRNAKQEDLGVCYSKIDAPLMPVYLRPFSEEQVEQIKQSWFV